MSSKKRILYLQNELAIYYRKLDRVKDMIEKIEREINRESDKCWSCVNTNPDSTDLVICEVRNKNYPLCCEEFK